MLKVDHLSVSYGQIRALNDVSFQVRKNQIVSLIGASGAGKTTTLMAISGMIPKEEGTILLDGKDISREKPHLISRMRLSHVPEGRRVFSKLTVEDNILAGSISNREMTKGELAQNLEEMYQLFPRLRERRKQEAGTLSGGEQQMLAIARGLVSNPEIVMLDEPSLGLAPIVVDEIFELILKIRDSGTTVLLIEQNASLALQIADYAYVLELGNLALQGTGRELLSNPEVKKAYLGI